MNFTWNLLKITICLCLTFYSIQSKAQEISAADSVRELTPERFYSQEEQLVNTVLTRYHYNKFSLNDSLSSIILDRYLKSLDFNKLYFLQSDISKFDSYRSKLDDFIIEGDLNAAYNIYNTFRERVTDRINYVHEILKQDFDYTIDENYEANRDSAEWASTPTELNEFWRKRIKNDALNLKLAGKLWDSVAVTLTKRYDNIQKAIDQTKSDDVFQIYLNAYTESVDPHSNYLLPITSDNFKIDMSRALEGIGAQLRSEDDYTKVVEIITGGPAYKSNLLHRDDRIISVAQGDSGDMVDVVGWRINDVVQLIRGPKGSVVRLMILKASDGVNAVPKEIRLVRDKVKLEDQSAKQQILEFYNNDVPYKIGVISIPAFYADYEAERKGDKNFKSTTHDVRKLLNELQNSKVDGIIIDLRNNGGGSLDEAIELTGLFIKDGPIVQVKQTTGAIDIAKDPDPDIAYSGPLAVLVNRFSASASEIFSAAIQDYGRGIILGENTFGKGTVQNLIDLNRLTRVDEKLGQVKITIAKFYRVSGGSTQNLGVVPDIKLPSPIDVNEFGESSEPNALPWDQIRAADFTPFNNVQNLIPVLKTKHDDRVNADLSFQSYVNEINESREHRKRKLISLNYETRKKEKEELENKSEELKNELRSSSNIKLIEKGEVPQKEKTSDDVLLNESAYILSDLAFLTTG